MRALLFKYWDRVRSSFWFVPSLMVVGSIACALGAVTLDESVPDGWLERQHWAYTGGAEGASAVLGTIAGSMITIAGVIFSMTLVALSLASSQLGPRLLRNFMRDTTNQVVLGTFIATFIYCLLVLRAIRRAEDGGFVPHLSVTIAVLLAIASLAVLIHFIHHVSVTIQADEVVARVGDELIESVERVFPEQNASTRKRAPDEVAEQDAGAHRTGPVEEPRGDEHSIAAATDGYLQLVDSDALTEVAVKADVQFRVELRPGNYVVRGGPLASVRPASKFSEELAKDVRLAFAVARQRTSAQDIEFSVEQLVEIAVRALSPGINDPFTAIRCVDRLGSALCRAAERDLPDPRRYDEGGRLRVVGIPVTFPRVLDAAFDQIRQAARANAAVTLRLLETLATVAGRAHRSEDRGAIERHADMILRGVRDGLPEEEDRKEAASRYDDVRTALRRG